MLVEGAGNTFNIQLLKHNARRQDADNPANIALNNEIFMPVYLDFVVGRVVF